MKNSEKNKPSTLVIIVVVVLILMILGYLILTMFLPEVFKSLDNTQ